jgi:hypothetical protein
MACGLALTHFGLPFLCAPVHFFGSNIFYVLSETPLMAEGVTDFSIAITPELIVKGHFDFGAGFNCAIEEGVDILRVEEERVAWRGVGIRGFAHSWEFVTEHDDRVANAQFGVSDRIAGAVHAHNFLSVKDLLVEIDGFCGVLAG